MGTFIRNIQRQPHSGPSSWISSPPITGPTAVATATVVASSAKARARSWPRKCCWMRATVCGFRSPEPRPWRIRERLSISTLGASPASSEPRVKIPTPITNMRRRPVASPSRPAGTSRIAKASA
jgi:hypothetical protein